MGQKTDEFKEMGRATLHAGLAINLPDILNEPERRIARPRA